MGDNRQQTRRQTQTTNVICKRLRELRELYYLKDINRYNYFFKNYFTPGCSCSWLHNNNNHVAFFVKRTHFIQENHQFIQYFRSLVHSFIVFSSGVKKIAAKNKCIIVLQIQATYQLYTLRCQKHFQITRQKKKLQQIDAKVCNGTFRPRQTSCKAQPYKPVFCLETSLFLKIDFVIFRPQPRIDPKKLGRFQKIKILKFDNSKICSIFPTDSLVLYVEKNESILG